MNLTWRALTLSDAAQGARLLAASEVVDQTGENYSEEDFAELLTHPMVDLENGTLAVFDGETLVGHCFVYPRTTADPVHLMQCGGTVDPGYRRRGLGGKLLSWALEAAVPIHEKRFPGQPLELVVGTDNKNVGNATMLTNAGFAPTRWFFEMRCGLTAEGGAPVDADGAVIAPQSASSLAEGLTMTTFREDLDEPLRLSHNEAFLDHWGSSPQSLETWQHSVTGSRSFRPELTFLALDDATGQVAGYVVGEYFEADTEVTGIRELYLAIIGTLRPWRRRGVAAALIAECLAEAKRLGYQRASLGVDADNPTGALGVYHRAGFKEYLQSTAYSLPLVPKSGSVSE